ncbi:DNA-directed RNA polymerase II subunit rpb1 [Rhizophlyctis rosea]|uniref:DNA-directed RNA polymerase II subunit rpb1 n=1 Tax=Rhizophlyctis rosea TaxID=64517 RepID=A0AAD5X0B1_9FUNG|nr:DNA-directed RNA polymerase II subunit rpb1 [Rhizophlyctis rosea]
MPLSLPNPYAPKHVFRKPRSHPLQPSQETAAEEAEKIRSHRRFLTPLRLSFTQATFSSAEEDYPYSEAARARSIRRLRARDKPSLLPAQEGWVQAAKEEILLGERPADLAFSILQHQLSSRRPNDDLRESLKAAKVLVDGFGKVSGKKGNQFHLNFTIERKSHGEDQAFLFRLLNEVDINGAIAPNGVTSIMINLLMCRNLLLRERWGFSSGNLNEPFGRGAFPEGFVFPTGIASPAAVYGLRIWRVLRQAGEEGLKMKEVLAWFEKSNVEFIKVEPLWRFGIVATLSGCDIFECLDHYWRISTKVGVLEGLECFRLRSYKAFMQFELHTVRFTFLNEAPALTKESLKTLIRCCDLWQIDSDDVISNFHDKRGTKVAVDGFTSFAGRLTNRLYNLMFEKLVSDMNKSLNLVGGASDFDMSMFIVIGNGVATNTLERLLNRHMGEKVIGIFRDWFLADLQKMNHGNGVCSDSDFVEWKNGCRILDGNGNETNSPPGMLEILEMELASSDPSSSNLQQKLKLAHDGCAFLNHTVRIFHDGNLYAYDTKSWILSNIDRRVADFIDAMHSGSRNDFWRDFCGVKDIKSVSRVHRFRTQLEMIMAEAKEADVGLVLGVSEETIVNSLQRFWIIGSLDQAYQHYLMDLNDDGETVEPLAGREDMRRKEREAQSGREEEDRRNQTVVELDNRTALLEALESMTMSDEAFRRKYKIDMRSESTRYALNRDLFENEIRESPLSASVDASVELEEDRKLLRTLLLKGEFDKKWALAGHIMQWIKNAQLRFSINRNERLDMGPDYVFDKVRDLCGEMVFVGAEDNFNSEDGGNAWELYQILIRSVLASRRVLEEFQLNRAGFDHVLERVGRYFEEERRELRRVQEQEERKRRDERAQRTIQQFLGFLLERAEEQERARRETEAAQRIEKEQLRKEAEARSVVLAQRRKDVEARKTLESARRNEYALKANEELHMRDIYRRKLAQREERRELFERVKAEEEKRRSLFEILRRHELREKLAFEELTTKEVIRRNTFEEIRRQEETRRRRENKKEKASFVDSCENSYCKMLFQPGWRSRRPRDSQQGREKSDGTDGKKSFPIFVAVGSKLQGLYTSQGYEIMRRLHMLITLLRFVLVMIHEFAADNRISGLTTTIPVVSFVMLVRTVRYQIFLNFDGYANDVRAGTFAARFCSGIQAGIGLRGGENRCPAGFALLCV